MRFVKPIVLVLALVVGIFFVQIPNLHADESTELILKLLVKKGLITQGEANELKAQVMEVKDAPIAAKDLGKHAKAASWAERIKFKGDVRLRNEYIKRGIGSYQNRQRVRARAGVKAKVTDTVDAGLLFVTGANGVGSGRSTNQTLFQGFGTKELSIDEMYLNWKPNKNIQVTGGKYKNPLYHPGDLLWDSDLKFEGASTNLKYALEGYTEEPLDLMLNAGIFPLDDLGIDAKSPYLYAIQGGLGSSIGDDVDWKVFAGYLDFAKIRHTTSTSLVPTSGLMAGTGGYEYDYNVLELSGDVTLHYLEKEFDEPFNKPLKFFADYVNSPSAIGDAGQGFQIGVQLGKKPKKLGDWRLLYNYRFLGTNAFPDDFPDADFIPPGNTNVYGNELIFSYGIAKNISIELDYYAMRDMGLPGGTSSRDKWWHTIQTDLKAKF